MEELSYNKIKEYLLSLSEQDKNCKIRLSSGVVILGVDKMIRSHIHKLDLIQDKDRYIKVKHIAYYERLLKVYQYFKNEKTSLHT